jgi:hypothetical protein
MWHQIKELELIFIKMGEKTRRLTRIKSYLQGFLDEMVWRVENRNIEDKRKYLISILTTESWRKYVKRLKKIQKKRERRKHGNINP